jgi:hypothetical protein
MDDIAKLAWKNGALLVVCDGSEIWGGASGPLVKKLMIAATEAEREACAKMVEDYIFQTSNMEARGCLMSVAADIRARSNASLSGLPRNGG